MPLFIAADEVKVMLHVSFVLQFRITEDISVKFYLSARLNFVPIEKVLAQKLRPKLEGTVLAQN